MVDLSINYSYLNRHIKYLGSYLKVGICVVSIFLYKMGEIQSLGVKLITKRFGGNV